jgi:glutaminyl-tRNA synthetase
MSAADGAPSREAPAKRRGTGPETMSEGRSNFIREIIDADLAAGKITAPVTRFPPEPNGFLHIGHAKSICLNFGLAQTYQGKCHLRFDDTNPETEDIKFIESIQADIRWLGFEWGENLFFASDYFETLYGYAVHLIEQDLAFVCGQTVDEIRASRGTLSEAGTPSPDRDRPIAESLDLFRRMRAGEFADGTYTLRAKIHMGDANMKMRDPLLYRIRHAHHPRTGRAWCIYPMYDYAHCLSDAIEGITHSICTLEFENNRELYDWILERAPVDHVSRQYEMARLNLNYTILSKRWLLRLVQDGHVSGWDDPRMPTVAGIRRRGYTPEALLSFCEEIGVTKANTVLDVALLEHHLRGDLNHRAPRVMAVLDPLKVVITNYPADQEERFDASYWPHDVPKEGTRPVPFARELYIERGDFAENPPKKFYRLAPGREVRLRYAYFITCDEVIRDAAGAVVELRCSYDPETRGGAAADGRKVKGTLHWVSAQHALDAEVRVYDRLFGVAAPGKERDLLEDLNPDSLTVLAGCKIEPSVAHDPRETRYQFERQGYFWRDDDTRPGALVFNRIIALRDSWAKRTSAGQSKPAVTTAPTESAEPKRSDTRPNKRTAAQTRAAARAEDPTLAACFARFQNVLGLDEATADLLTPEHPLAALFEAAIAAYDAPASVAKWVINALTGLLAGASASTLVFDGAELGEIARLVDEKALSTTAGKEILSVLFREGGTTGDIVDHRGLRQVSDEGVVAAIVDQVLADHAEQVALYRGGKTTLLGFFVGRVMAASKGKANPQLAKTLLKARLDTP